MNIPEELYYTREHEWVRIEGDVALTESFVDVFNALDTPVI